MKKVTTGGGWPAVAYTFRKAKEAGGIWKLWKAMRSKNACKTCALGMGGQRGGMVNESGHFPEVCKKSLQAMVADMQGAITTDFWKKCTPEMLRSLSPKELEDCGRLTQPVLYTPELKRFQPISWGDAYDRIAKQLKALSPEETFWYFSGRSSNEAGFLLQLFARLYGTNNVNNCSYYCHQASGVGLTSVTGSGTATIQLEDLDEADLVFVIGGNPASNHPRLLRTLMQVRRRGGEVVVINPIVETGMVNFSVPSDARSLLFGSKIASLYVQPHIGGDLALLAGIAKQIIELNQHDQEFLDAHCSGWAELAASYHDMSWEEIIRKSGISREEIDKIADRYAKAENVVFSWTMGITHHENGVENVQAIANLALMRGMVGRPGAGLMPIRGHSNVQGIGSVGVTPKLKDAIFESLEKHYDVKLPTVQGRDTMDCMEGAGTGELKFGFCLGGNLYGSNPDAHFAEKSLRNLETLVYLSTTLNTGHAYGLAKETIILPVLARDEEPQPTTQESMFNYVRLSDGGPTRHEGPRSEIEVIADMAQRVLGPKSSGVDWSLMRDSGRIREAIAAVVPGFEKIASIAETKKEFQIGGRTFRDPQFATHDGKAQLHSHELPNLKGNGSQIRLMTIRSEGQFNTVVYEEHDFYRGVPRRDVILLHPEDITRLGLDPSITISVHGPAGSMRGIHVHPFEEIRPGNAAMYYPEANVLVSRHLDPKSKTPAFKCVLVTLESESLAVVGA
ncbi:FdhF/YdeP family oxidoreductase [Adhaeretor mobilis]|uniref:Formate dehydrogenase H n=1 Tax=Adhaeretor mobilis TaxID=1930276 RepID=A0A517MXB2_9BACT|nr:FdhF/YdeP family oxidoreductase [Adhaeretor mobilis]QDS99526.1 Formate dehydrogenase H [Adhaeretor mobilis]